MVDKKDAELEEVKKKEMDAVTQVKSLVLDLSKHKTESDELKKLLKTETTEKESATESIRTPSETSLRTKHIFTEDLKTPGRVTNRVGGTSKMKLYRIRTPPSAEKAAQWGKSTIELDPRSDSSDQNDLLSFVNAPELNISAPRCKLNIFKKLQSPATHKSPGNSLKLAAMKRMRDAGWTAVTGCDRKKKKTTEKIFA
ncbi:synaptonemal complex protein 1 [Acanthochromis polyacanthus]|uniref:synaptonemal complex protein 1 n=1 Tax=Acanthochromis polyacanthus TaxID=80966 RepID=UPI0022342693|nr:synaptonemal complex protein 1 [Acanthochromis polyacanthus]